MILHKIYQNGHPFLINIYIRRQCYMPFSYFLHILRPPLIVLILGHCPLTY